ncbi:MATE family efflux transporter [Natronospirillum operosum]|uniref:Multidrug-efflux transporter n=1 Tax=Natronospirillum operosum TaxID=2759953 RepID=A0A4Z0W6T5_9GAMM|nr:MATE family efflux transporter [Natronospirillum operosum]TGG90770.1 MATE family efflux transporter [Natronospirillum operosum]
MTSALSRRPLLKEVMTLAIPVAIQSALVAGLGMADVLMVSGLGETAVGAVGLGSKLNFVVILMMAAMGTSCSVLVAQYFGAGRLQRVREILALCLLVGTVLMLPITGLMIWQASALMALGTDNSQVMDQGTRYLVITAFSLWLTQLVIIYEGALRAIGNTRVPLYYAAVTIGLNVILNYWLINGGLGVPALGVAGAALATVLARIFQISWMFWGQQRPHSPLRLQRADFTAVWWNGLFPQFWRISWPLVLNFTLWAMGSLSYHLIAGNMGTRPLAVMSLLAPVEGIYHSLFFGVTNACAIMVGQRLGRGDFAETRYLVRQFLLWSPAGSLVLGVILLSLSPWFLPLMNLDVETLTMMQWAFAVMCLGFWIKVFNMTAIQGVLRSGGDSKFCLYLDMGALWLVGLPLTLAAAFWWQWAFPVVYAMILGEEVVKAGANLWRIRQYKWLQNLAAEDRPAAVE